MVLKSQTILIDSIRNSRQLRPDDDLTDLSVSVRHGLRWPLLVDEHMNLIDGLRRLQAYKLLGYTRINVVVSAQFEDSCETLAATRLHGLLAKPLEAYRIWEIFEATYEQSAARSARLRSRTNEEKAAHPAPRSRNMLGESLGFTGEGVLAAATALYKTFLYNEDPTRTEALEVIRARLEANEITMWAARGAVDRLEKGIFISGEVVSAHEQRAALATAASQLSGVVRGLARIGELNGVLAPAELAMYKRTFEIGRRDLQRFIKGLGKEDTEQ